MPSRAENYFEQYTGAGAAEVIKGLPELADPVFENEFLDFKSGHAWNATIKEAGKPTDDKAKDNLKAVWSKAIGQFANSEGGILIWGVNADKKKDSATGKQIDAPNAIVPVKG